MDIKKNNIRPIIIGVAGASQSGKQILRNQLGDILKDYGISLLFINYYHKHNSNDITISDEPSSFDFKKLLEDIEKLRIGQSVYVYDKHGTQIKVESNPIIIIEGVFTFYDSKVRNLLDIKLFIDVDLDSCLMNIINKELLKQSEYNISNIISNYHSHTRPQYVKYLTPSKKYADVIIPQIEENSAFIPILSEYLKIQMNKIVSGDLNIMFTSLNEIVDPKYQYFDKNILVSNERSHINFFKQVFEDVLTNNEEEFITDQIQDKLLSILNEHLFTFFQEKQFSKEGLHPKVDLMLTEFDELDKYDWTKYKKIVFFKVFIMSEDDIIIPEKIVKKNKNCNLIINSLFLAPKFAEILLSNKLDTLLLNTIYFSDFLNKFELVIKKNNKYFEPKKLAEKYKRKITDVFREDY